jgi:hypothetical protein
MSGKSLYVLFSDYLGKSDNWEQFCAIIHFTQSMYERSPALQRGSIEVKALRYKAESRGFEIQWDGWSFSIYLIFLASLVSGSYPASNRNEYQKQKNNVSGE